MVSTFPLLAASLLLGQTPVYPATSAPPASSKGYFYSDGTLVPSANGQQTTLSGQPIADSHHPILSKIHSWFKRSSTNGSTITSTSNSAGTTSTIRVNETAPPPISGDMPAPPKIITTPPPPIAVPQATTPGDVPRKMPTSFPGPASGSEVRATPTPDTVTPAALKALPTPAKSPILPGNAQRIGRDAKFAWVTGQLEMEKGQYVLYYATPETVDPYHGRIMLNPQKLDLRSFHSGDLVSVHGQLHAGHNTPVYQVTSADLIEAVKR